MGSSALCITDGWLSMCLLVITPGDIEEPPELASRWPFLTLVGPDDVGGPLPSSSSLEFCDAEHLCGQHVNLPTGSWRSCTHIDCGQGIEGWGQSQPMHCVLCVVHSFVSQRPKPCVTPCLPSALLWRARGLCWADVEVARLGTELCHLLAGIGDAGQG